MHNDEPTLLDALDRGSLIKEVGEAIANCTPPQVFGIHGDWGLGKTSFLHQVQWYLTAECPQHSEREIEEAARDRDPVGTHKDTVRTVWFDAWRYQHEEVPVVALLQEIRTQLSWGHQVAATAIRGAQTVVRGALLSMEGLTKQIGFQYSKFRDANREWDVRNLAVSLPSHTLREHLRETIGRLLSPQNDDNRERRLAIFIDDVDRCEPEVAYRLLEGLKIYLTLDNCVFVLGMNQKAVEQAIGRQMGGGPDKNQVKSRAAAYMEKLCQNVWQLPAIRNPSEVLHGLLKDTVRQDRIRELIKQAVEETPCLPPNPRRLKGLANLIGRLAERFPKELQYKSNRAAVIAATILVIVAYIYQFHTDLFIRWEAESDLYNKIYDRCQGNNLEINLLDQLVLPKRIVTSDDVSTPSSDIESTYPDPTGTNIFWIQPLILKLGSEVTSANFERYLHGGQRDQL